MDEQRGRHTYRQGNGRAKYQVPVMPTTQAGSDDPYEDVWPVRQPSSARRYQGLTNTHVQSTTGAGLSPIPPRSHQPASQLPAVVNIGGTFYRLQDHPDEPAPVVRNNRVRNTEDDLPIQHSDHLQLADNQRPRFHWLVFVGMALFTMLIGWIALTMLSNWWQVTQDDWHYGRPRTYQVDMVVGHNDSAANPSHFIALNLKSHVEVIEFPGGDAAHARIFLGPTLIGQGSDLAPVTLTFKDVTGNGKLDMIVNVQNSHFVFINDGGTFRPARPGEPISTQ